MEEDQTEEVPDDYLENLSLSSLIVTNMKGGFRPDQIETVQELFVEQVQRGEKDLRRIFRHFRDQYLPNPQIKGCRYYADYLRTIYGLRPKNLDQLIRELEKGRQVDLLDIYPRIGRKSSDRKKKGGFVQFLEEGELPVEVAYSRNSNLVGIIVRRKDTDRAIQKIAYRVVMLEIAEALRLEAENNPKKRKMETNGKELPSPLIGDWFGMKIVGTTEVTARQLFRGCSYNLKKLWFERDSLREKILDQTGQPTGKYQPPGVDDHYHYGRGYDRLIQLKVRGINDYSYARREICFTDVANMLIDEVDHVKFRQKQDSLIEELSAAKRIYKIGDHQKKMTPGERYEQLMERGHQIDAMLPRQRPRVLMPEVDF